MNFSPSWKALYGQLAKEQRDLKDFCRFVELLTDIDAAMLMNIQQLTMATHCAALVSCNGKVKIIHHFHHDVKSPVLLDGKDELWALCGHGTMSCASGSLYYD
jgi:hypothetical protein